MIDSHAHLHHEDFASDRDAVIQRLEAAGIQRVLEVGIDLPGAESSLELARRYPVLLVAVGCHPHEAANWSTQFAHQMRRWAQDDRVAAFGEIGLDFYRDWSPRDRQELAFREQLRLARELAMPVIFHVRAAEEAFLRVLDEEGNPERGVMHAFSHGADFAGECLRRGFWLGIGGMITFPRSPLPEILATVPPERVLLETDCPWLAPVPRRGRRNEPAFLSHVLARLAGIWGLTQRELEAILDRNFLAFARIL
jgi:TatD DNase family protein